MLRISSQALAKSNRKVTIILKLARAWIFVCGLFLIVNGCCTTQGPVKTPLTDRVRKSYPSIGISIESPKEPKDTCACYTLHLYDGPTFESFAHVKAHLVLCMNPVWTGPTVEPNYLLTFYISRVTPQEFKNFLLGEQYLNGIFGDHPESFRSEVSTYKLAEKHGTHKFLVFRKDIRLKDGDIVVAGATLLDNEQASPSNEEDIHSISEILDSIEPLAEFGNSKE
jgi:hypothetical protein